jgi:hypothetical protein
MGLDSSACFTCGNGIKEPAEACDGNALNNRTCAAEGFTGGSLHCRSDCLAFDVSTCTNQACADGLDNDGDGYPDRSDNDCYAAGSFVATNIESNAQSGCNANPDPLNLVRNAAFECDADSDGKPDQWSLFSVGTGYSGTWISDPLTGNSFLQSENAGTGTRTLNRVWEENRIPVKPNRWYELSFSMATDGFEPPLTAAGGIDPQFYYTGLNVYARTITDSYSQLVEGSEFVGLNGPALGDWSDSEKAYHVVLKKGFEGWETVKVYFKTPPDTNHLQLGLVNFANSKVMLDNLVLHELAVSPIPPMPKSGSLEFSQFKGADFFPIVVGGVPQSDESGNGIFTYDRFVADGFNSVAVTYTPASSGYGPTIQNVLQNNMGVIPGVPSLYYRTDGVGWVNDPAHAKYYTGWQSGKAMMDAWKGFSNLLAFELPDESNAGGANATYLPEIRNLAELSSYARSISRSHIDFHPGMYNGQGEALASYLGQADSMVFTQNLFRAYPFTNPTNTDQFVVPLGRVGSLIRHARSLAQANNLSVRFWAFGLGVYYWSRWNPAWDAGGGGRREHLVGDRRDRCLGMECQFVIENSEMNPPMARTDNHFLLLASSSNDVLRNPRTNKMGFEMRKFLHLFDNIFELIVSSSF